MENAIATRSSMAPVEEGLNGLPGVRAYGTDTYLIVKDETPSQRIAEITNDPAGFAHDLREPHDTEPMTYWVAAYRPGWFSSRYVSRGHSDVAGVVEDVRAIREEYLSHCADATS